ncbi:hypothetical protein TVAG_169860 [Trichomonas vaginalis G3]|uniref:HYDIN/VesB/CFA65-like Ig-like domain-containing protein n=1 Tax=Trichomonas vaginalis (strain ATCC PRA-98 / G3) TaxID=412133 RepID=A2DPD0_TRIV3|nr:deleted in lung and esophageal cancer 1 (DLEC1) family [Trichomonas vaginalis G3]EAY17674.1 hypothetical protein TVAG_169860 [Trichomonas vaginalis G3]KAI5507922.1 deleted in lung and esophageal cancer 1 (DLEC1) family [Trichomonas vaginalis G3]|eukprot:XP_001329809.1 hypothetical protein [Trichomonas vaginalis G3]
MRRKPQVRVEPLTLSFPNTYITTTNRYAFQVFNDSTEQIKFEFRKFNSAGDEKSFLIRESVDETESKRTKNEMLLFKSDIFEFIPSSGTLWPKRFITVIALFHPSAPGPYTASPTLYIDRFKERHQMLLKGLALPAAAKFNISGINIGTVELGSVLEYEIELKNTGQIPCEFTIANKDVCGVKYEFNPNAGTIQAGESTPIRLTFTAGHVFVINEVFSAQINGNPKSTPSISLFGRIVGPKFLTSVNIIEFGRIACGTITTQRFELQNHSEIPFNFSWRVPEDGSFADREFNIIPSGGIAEPFSKTFITVELMPVSPKNIRKDLVLDIENFGQNLITIPIMADIIAPRIEITPNGFKLGAIFIHSQNILSMKMKNTSTIVTNYEFIPPTGLAGRQCAIEPVLSGGEIPPDTEVDFSVSLSANELGILDTFFNLHLLGTDILVPVHIEAVSVGPDVEFSTKKIDFGKINVLKEEKRILTLKNNSSIEAFYTGEISHEMFSVVPTEAVIKPGESLDVEINTYLVDAGRFETALIVKIKDIPQVVVPVKALGIGVPIVPSIDFDTINVGSIITEHPHQIPFTITNRGLRWCTVTFICQKPKTPNGTEVTFSVTPVMQDLEPNVPYDYVMTIQCPTPTEFECHCQCHASIGPMRVVMFSPEIFGQFNHPKLLFNPKEINYVHTHDYVQEEKTIKGPSPKPNLLPKQTQIVSIFNKAKFPVDFVAIPKDPFSLSKYEFHMEGESQEDIIVTFNADQKLDYFSNVIKQKIMFDMSHTKKFGFFATAEYQFPNLTFSETTIDYGVLLKNTEKSHEIILTNNSVLPVIFEWTLNDKTDDFDIYPIRGVFNPNESAKEYFTFTARTDSIESEAICHVDGGPDYTIKLKGGSDLITFNVTPKVIDLGAKRFSQSVNSSFVIENTSSCLINYELKVEHLTDLFITINDPIGQLNPSEKKTINFNVKTTHPQNYKERIIVCIGGVQDEFIDLLLNAQFDNIQIGESDKSSELSRTFTEFLSSRSIESPKKAQPFVCDSYEIDMGRIVLGDKKEKELPITSHSLCPIKCRIVATELENTGFYFEPMNFILDPNQTMNLKVIYDTSKREKLEENVKLTASIMMADGVQTPIVILADLVVPEFEVSLQNMNFESVIVGQWRSISFQVRNKNEIDVEFSVNNTNQVFSSNPQKAIIKAKSFANFDITFTPKESKPYENTLKIEADHSDKPFELPVKGIGERIIVEFDPPQLRVPTIQPFSTASESEVKIINKSKHHIEIFSYQFDFKNYADLRMSLTNTNSQAVFQNDSDSDDLPQSQRFVPCIIVHGTKYSGKTSVSKYISEKFGLPIVVLKDIWEKVESDAGADFISAFTLYISDPKYDDGFIIDGLNGFPEGNNDALIQKVIKTKASFEDLYKNPFTDFQHETFTSAERSLRFVLAGLNGQHVFLIALQMPEEVYQSRVESLESEEKKLKEQAHQERKQELINMNDEEYWALDPKEQESADKRRKASRDRVIKKAIEADEEKRLKEEKESKRKKKTSSSSHRSHSTSSKDRRREKSPDKDKKSRDKSPDKTPEEPEEKKHSKKEKKEKKDKKDKEQQKKQEQEMLPKEHKKRKIAIVPNDPLILEAVTFQFTLGSIASMIEKPKETFNVVNPTNVVGIDTAFIQNVCIQHVNTLMIWVDNQFKYIYESIDKFLPEFEKLETSIYKTFLPHTKKGISKKVIPPEISERPHYFKITSDDPVIEPPQQSPRKSGRTSRKGRSREPPMYPFLDEINLNDYTPRWKIDPEESKTITVSFNTNLIGEYNQNLYFGLVSTKTDIFKLPVTGFCIMPEICREPEQIFAKVLPKKTKKTAEAFTIKDNTYHFGMLLVTKEKPTKNGIPPYKAVLTIKNISEFNAEIATGIIECQNKAPWQIDVLSPLIKPNEQTTINVGIYPNATDVYNMTLLITVKDNPVPLRFSFSAEASQPTVTFSTAALDFGRILTKATMELPISITNNSQVPVMWSLKHNTMPAPPFTLSKTEDTIPPKQTTEIVAGFSSVKAVVAKKQFIFEMQAPDKSKQYGTHVLNLQGEAFDSVFDIQYSPKQNAIVFGTLKVNQSKNVVINLRSRSKYPSQFTLTLNNHIQQLVKVNPTTGPIPVGDKMTALTFTFCANKCVSFNNYKVGTIVVTDTQTNVQCYKADIMMQAQTVFNTYEIAPFVDFGPIQVSTNNTRTLTLKNTGPFPMEYNLAMKPEPPPVKIVKGKEVVGKPPPTPKPKMRKGQGMQLQIGNFVVCPCQGTIQPGATANISVELQTNVVGKTSSIATLKASDTDASKPQINEIELKADVISPSLFNQDYEPIFAGTNFCLRNDIIKNNVTAFLEDEHMLHFAPSMLGQKQTAVMHVINPTPIQVTADVNLKPKTKSGMSTFPFDVGSKQVTIEANGSVDLPITYMPNTEGSFIGYFECIARGSTDPKGSMLKFVVEGIAALPTISADKSKTIPLGRVLVGSSRERAVAVKNDGLIPATFTISQKSCPCFTLKETETEVTLNPGRQFMLTAVFNPQKVQRYNFEVNLAVTENPKCSYSFNFAGDGFFDDIVFEGDAAFSEDSDVSFANTVVGRKAESLFLVRNISSTDVRFLLPQHHDFSFSPRIVQLQAGHQIRVDMSFFSDKPVKHQGIKLPVSWFKLEQCSGDWDDSSAQKQKGTQVVEPPFRVLGAKQKDLYLRVTATTDVIKYTIDTHDIDFSPTMMYETRSVEVRLTNTSSIRLEYAWELQRFTALRTDYATTRKPCFKVLPSSGTVDGGKTTVFKVVFAPEEVDDFTAEFMCKIPFLIGNPPVISMNGISRRPLCHFDVDVSDYLTRRHPAYIDNPLPEDIQVIELYSKAVGSKTIKKFDVINPTSMPYEVIFKCEDESNTAIQCLMSAALISAGRRYSFAFSYLPTSVRTVESIWTFSIPVHNISRHILFVGRIMPE